MFVKQLLEKKNDLITRAEAVLEKAKSETRALTEDEDKEITALRAEAEGIDKTIAQAEAVEGMEKKEIKEEDKPVGEGEKEDVEVAEERAFENYIRGVVVNERAGELTPAANSAGKTIPTTIANKIIERVYDVAPILARSTKMNVKGKLDIPTYTEGITVAYATEFQALTSTSGTFTTITLDGFLAGALTKVSRSLVNNSQFDIVSFVIDKMAKSIARWIEKELLIGTTDKVTGLSTATLGVTAAASTVITTDEIVDLHDKIKQAYQANAIWVMNAKTLTALRKLKDANNHYLLQNDLTAPFGYTILGKPVFVSDNMPEMAANTIAIYYGDMAGLTTKFSETVNIEVLREKYADEHAIGVNGWFEFDAKITDTQAIAALKMAAA